MYKILYAMEVSSNEKAKLVAYHHKDVAQTLYNQWRENKDISWEVFRRTFLDSLFPRDKREEKVVGFFNLCKGGMSLLEYSLKFA